MEYQYTMKLGEDEFLKMLINAKKITFPEPTPEPENLRPREHLCRDGCGALSDRELIALVLNTGIKGKNVTLLAEELLKKIDSSKKIPEVEELCQIKGLGTTKASVIVAMLEFCRRRWGTRGSRIKQPYEIFNLIRHFADYPQERFIALSLNAAHEVLASRIVTIGLVNKTIIHPREVFADVISDRASAFCVAHNHPSGSLHPSEEDNQVTECLHAAAGLLGIRFLDHIIFTADKYFSYRESGLLVG